jgi:beta-glucosidase/6-phospho-beta-glucosidase/beta-galactosidase
MTPAAPFASFLMGGFECASHRWRDGRRVDPLGATGHDRSPQPDYALLARHGIRTVREGLRWHLMEPEPGRYDFSDARRMIEAARGTGTQIVWDLCHYGYPDFVDPWGPGFADGLARFAGAFAHVLAQQNQSAPVICPMNEMSYWAWAGAEEGHMNPAALGQGDAFKQNLLRAARAAAGAVRAVLPAARMLFVEPVINIVPPEDDAALAQRARERNEGQWQVWDALAAAGELDVVGVNFYPWNQWILGANRVSPGDREYVPLRALLQRVYRRYRRPLVIAETSCEGDCRGAWFGMIANEVEAAMTEGVPVSGLCLYPVLDYPAWDDGRLCACGLLGGPAGARTVHAPLAREVARWRPRLMAAAGMRLREAA